jgi:hypothetical protein
VLQTTQNPARTAFQKYQKATKKKGSCYSGDWSYLRADPDRFVRSPSNLAGSPWGRRFAPPFGRWIGSAPLRGFAPPLHSTDPPPERLRGTRLMTGSTPPTPPIWQNSSGTDKTPPEPTSDWQFLGNHSFLTMMRTRVISNTFRRVSGLKSLRKRAQSIPYKILHRNDDSIFFSTFIFSSNKIILKKKTWNFWHFFWKFFRFHFFSKEKYDFPLKFFQK